MSQICAFTVLSSTLIDLVANSTPIVDFDSRLNSFRVNRESTGAQQPERTGRRWVSQREGITAELDAQSELGRAGQPVGAGTYGCWRTRDAKRRQAMVSDDNMGRRDKGDEVSDGVG